MAPKTPINTTTTAFPGALWVTGSAPPAIKESLAIHMRHTMAPMTRMIKETHMRSKARTRATVVAKREEERGGRRVKREPGGGGMTTTRIKVEPM